jgi:hypothetical protein
MSTVMGVAILATLAFFTRLANLPVAASVAALAIPIDVAAQAVWRPMAVARRISWKLVVGVALTLALALVLLASRAWFYTGVFSFTYGTSFGINRVWLADMPLSVGFQRMIESFGVLLTLNDPPRFSLYSIPLLLAAAASVGAMARITGLREMPLAAVLFFAGCSSLALLVRGIAYSGRYSTHLLGAGCAVATLAVALLVMPFTRRRLSSPESPQS